MGTRAFLGLIMGAVGGLVAWIATDFIFNPLSDPERMLHPPNLWLPWVWGAAIGFFIGLGLGLTDGVASGSRARVLRSALRGALSGALGGGVGFTIANTVFAKLGGHSQLGDGGFLEFITQAVIRAIGWAVLGILMGGLYGAIDTGLVKARNGAIGGALGGFLAGLIFNPLTYAMPQALPFITAPDRFSRLVGWILLGALIGFFTALAQSLLKSAWVMVVYGRNEGREFILEKAITRIGRNELAEIPIFRDRLLAQNHAEIRAQGNRYLLVDGGSAVGASVNGQRVTQPVMLKDSDLIQVGNTQVIFYERATAAPLRRQVDLSHASPAAPALVPEGVCAFCGQQKNPATGACACTVAAIDAGSGLAPAPFPGTTDFAPAGYGPPIASPTGFPPAGAANPGFGDSALPFNAGATMAVPGLATPGTAASTGQLTLIALQGPHTGEVYPLVGGQATVGRDPSNSIALTRDTTVSRRHAALTTQGGECMVTDLGSSNGTFVNGVRITSQAARPGDEIAFGTARFRLQA